MGTSDVFVFNSFGFGAIAGLGPLGDGAWNTFGFVEVPGDTLDNWDRVADASGFNEFIAIWASNFSLFSATVVGEYSGKGGGLTGLGALLNCSITSG